jgi:hypothetical protein
LNSGVDDQTSGVDYSSLSAAVSASSSNDVLLVPAVSYVESFPDSAMPKRRA